MNALPDRHAHPRHGPHWLDEVLRRIKPGDSTYPHLPDDLEGAWDMAAAFCGFTHLQLAQEIAHYHGLRTEPLPLQLPADAVRLMRLPVLREYRAVPVRRGEEHLVLAVPNPAAPGLVQRVCFAAGLPVELLVAPPAELRRLYEAAGLPLAVAHEEGEPEEPLPARAGEFRTEPKPDDNAVVRLCNVMLEHAIRHAASDIHVQPVGNGGLVRMRLDGLLRVVGRLPAAVMQRLVGRIKAVAGMNPTDRLHPQDAHARVVAPGRTLDLRLATLPVTGGEKLVMRLLGGPQVLRLVDLDLAPSELQQLRNLIDASMGLVVVAGPTGSGKTTTLYAVLHEKNTPDVNIVTVEDPVEIRMPRLAQTEVNPRSGLDFANALRSVVRQDPDIILIGEIRDAETAGIAMQAAITGHLVFASVHANDAVSVLPRLAELGVGADLAGEAVRGIVSQRLVRRLCPACAQPAQAPFTPEEQWVRAHAGVTRHLRATGCAECAGTGYKGRRSIVQVLSNTPEVARLLDHGAPLSQVREAARRQGMRSLSESALDRVRRGQTSLEEVLRVMGTDFWREIGGALGIAEPPPAALPVPERPDEERGTLLVVAKSAAWRETLQAWARGLGWPVITASDEPGVRQAMTHHADFGLVVIDLDQVDVERSRVLLEMRASLAGAAVPLLVFEADGNTTELARAIGQQGHALLASRPHDAQALKAQIERALA